MQVFGLDIGHIVELGTQLAQAGAIRAAEVAGDEVFEYTVGIAILIYEEVPTQG